jgi:hypothetical protein
LFSREQTEPVVHSKDAGAIVAYLRTLKYRIEVKPGRVGLEPEQKSVLLKAGEPNEYLSSSLKSMNLEVDYFSST